MSEPRQQYLAVKGFYSLMIRAQKYKMAHTAVDAAEALCGPFGMCMDDERERNISQARDIAAYLLELAEHLEHRARQAHVEREEQCAEAQGDAD